MLQVFDRLFGAVPVADLVVSAEASYLLLLFGLLIVPKVLQRFRIPSAITCFMFGTLCGPGLGLFRNDSTVTLFSTLGISSLFLFAGLEVSGAELRREGRVLTEHLILRIAGLAMCTWALTASLDLPVRQAVLVALAVLTPSTGFILDSLPALRLSKAEAFWVRSKAIGTEILALSVLFVVLQSGSGKTLGLSALALLGLVVALPLAFRAFASFIVPYAPKTEFAFLLMIAVLCALATKRLGVYYLVGAFLTGVAAQQFRSRLPAIASEQMLHAVEAFASVSVPFYFFHAGTEIRRDNFSWEALGLGLLFLAIGVPLRLLSVTIHRRIRLLEPSAQAMRVTIPLLPSLVFTLVLAEILRERYAISPVLFGALVVYAIGTTLLPAFIFKTPPVEFDSPEAPPLPYPAFAALPTGEAARS
jgi:Kef-type K+ transport system membrane component KefB